MRRILAFAAAVAGCTAQNLSLETPDLLLPPPPDLSTTGSPFGSPCVSSIDCMSGVCLATGLCSSTCSPLATCPTGWVCAPTTGGASVCQCSASGREVCNGRDDDCDGIIDNDPVCNTPICIAPTGTSRLKLVTNKITLPQQRTEFAFDLNGDGKVDNQYGNIVGALTAQNLNLQADADADVAAGLGLLLLDELSNGTSSDPCVSVEVVRATQKNPPDFSGSGSYTQLSGVLGADLIGEIAQARFNAASPAIATQPMSLDVRLPGLAFGAGGVDVRITAAHIAYTHSAGGVMKGEVHGAIGKDDIKSMIRNVGAVLNQRVQSDPLSSNSKQLLQIFDQGCADPIAKNFDGTTAAKADGKIAECEVAENAIIKNVLAPDVDLFAPDGSWRPNPANTDKDSLSIGFGFTAVGAKF